MIPGISRFIPALLAAAVVGFSVHGLAADDGDGIVKVGAGSYTTKLPPGAKYPSYTQYKTDNVKGPLPLSQWWISQLCWPLDKSSPLYGHPLGVRYDPTGLRVYYPGPRIRSNNAAIWAQMWDDTTDLRIGLAGEDLYTESKVDAFSDWFVSVVSKSTNGKTIRTSYGHGSPFVYATTDGTPGAVTVYGWPKLFSGGANDAVLAFTMNGRSYAIFGPTGSKWAGVDKFPDLSDAQIAEAEKNAFAELDGRPKPAAEIPTLTLTNNSAKYFSVALLPDSKPSTLAAFQKVAYNFVTDTKVEWKYETPGVMKTTFTYTVDPKEGKGTDTVFALYPHQWKYSKVPLLDSGSSSVRGAALEATYSSVRGTMKIGTGSSFTTEIPIQGVLPMFPAASTKDKDTIAAAVKEAAGGKWPGAMDTYSEGKLLGRLATFSEAAEAVGDTASQKVFIDELKRRFKDWFTAAPGKSNPIFYYDANWNSLIGYRGSFGSDVNCNDHHFHYGYFIRAAAEVARVDPAWAKDYGGMVNMLIRDIATSTRDDKMFAPFRSFDRYAGHCWAAGDGKALDGLNQESSSESMNAWYGVTLWGQVTGDTATRDLGMYIYNTEMTAIEEYWFNVSGTNYPADYPNVAVGMIWGGKGAHGTWFSGDIDWVHGINEMPYTPGSVYLGRYPDYVKKNVDFSIKKRAGGSNYNTGVGDLLLMFHATQDPADATKVIAEHPQTKFEAGNTSAFFNHWINTFNAYGQIDRTVTSTYPIYTVFKKDSTKTYLVYNYSDEPITVTFSDGMKVTAKKGVNIAKE